MNAAGSAGPRTIRAWVVPEHGGIDVLRLEERPMPEPGHGEVRIRAIRGGLNHLDLWVRRGVPGHPFPLPLIPISDVAGVVDAVGPGVDDLQPGTRVVLVPGVSCESCGTCLEGEDPLCRDYGIRGETFDGGAAEYIVVPRNQAIELPDSVDWDVGAAFGLTFMTAYRMLHTRGKVRRGDWVLVHAAGSGVSSAAIRLAKLAGARVIATAGSAEKIARAEAFGIEKVINYRETDFATEVRAMTGGRGVDLIIDHIGKDTFEGNIRCLAKGGRLVICGNTSGAIVETNLAMVFYKGLSILGSTMGSRAEFQKCLDLVARGLVGPVIDRVFAFEELPKAHGYLEARKAFGKVLIRIKEE
jgi:NADPH:quinone reductase-like Zn-dependent oxidoreductase